MQRSDVIILGGGLVGLALAAALDSSGLNCTVVDPADPEARKDAAFDGRTSALSSSSKRMFDTIGISEYFPVPGCPIRRIEVADGLDPGGLVFDPGDDDESETVPCPYCKRQIHEDAERCPYCEQYISAEDAPPGRKPWWIIIGALLCLYVIYRWIVG